MDRLAQILVLLFRSECGIRGAHNGGARLLNLPVGRHQMLRRISQPFERRTERISHVFYLTSDDAGNGCTFIAQTIEKLVGMAGFEPTAP